MHTYRKIKMTMLLGIILCLATNTTIAASAGAGGLSEAVPSSFRVLAQKEFPEGSYGPGYPITYRVLARPTFATKPMAAADIRYGDAHEGGFAEFSDGFIANAVRPGTHTLEVGFGNGYHARRMLEDGEGIPFKLSLVEISQENVDGLKPIIAKKKTAQTVQLYKAFDGRKFLNGPAADADSLDNVGLFHVMHFWSPSEILRALTNIHTRLKPGGTLTVTLSDNAALPSSKYREDAATKPWVTSVFAHPLMSESYKITEGAKKGQIVTYLPAGALAELLTACGFEVLQVASYSDFYPQNVPTPFKDYVEYGGVRARKAGAPNPELLAKWVEHAAACDAIRATDHSTILYEESQQSLAGREAIFKLAHAAEGQKRRVDLWRSIGKGSK